MAKGVGTANGTEDHETQQEKGPGFFKSIGKWFKFGPRKEKKPILHHPRRQKYIPKYAHRDAVRSFRPTPPVLPKDLRCVDSDFAMDRLAPRGTSVVSDEYVPPPDPSYTYTAGTDNDTMSEKRRGKQRAQVSYQPPQTIYTDYLGAPINRNMKLAIDAMPCYRNRFAKDMSEVDDLTHRTVTLSDGFSYPAPKAHAEWFRGGHAIGRTTSDTCVTDSSLSIRPSVKRPSSWDATAIGDGALGNMRTSLNRTYSYTDIPLNLQSPGVYLAAQRHALIDKDQIYYRHGNIPHMLRRSSDMNKAYELRKIGSISSDSSSITPPYPSSSSSSSNRTEPRSQTSRPLSNASGSWSQDESQPSSSSQISSTIKEDSEAEAKAEADHPRQPKTMACSVAGDEKGNINSVEESTPKTSPFKPISIRASTPSTGTSSKFREKLGDEEASSGSTNASDSPSKHSSASDGDGRGNKRPINVTLRREGKKEGIEKTIPNQDTATGGGGCSHRNEDKMVHPALRPRSNLSDDGGVLDQTDTAAADGQAAETPREAQDAERSMEDETASCGGNMSHKRVDSTQDC
ncbi:Pre-mRNA-splicing factor prp46 [Sphaceloma murrayae]|uniref:Pre-mRNA-splicing factor prp46 n=1 Tax=Sphaceloma murrayae TaxID=2082308 RepID=A0A2K1QLY3_9PEZI|nr:Pre-mRNA-splicing factor prp46 [Sphaceloma murrayae]